VLFNLELQEGKEWISFGFSILAAGLTFFGITFGRPTRCPWLIFKR
jgi:hypothetical protein